MTKFRISKASAFFGSSLLAATWIISVSRREEL
jgi:hypothetical protein